MFIRHRPSAAARKLVFFVLGFCLTANLGFASVAKTSGAGKAAAGRSTKATTARTKRGKRSPAPEQQVQATVEPARQASPPPVAKPFTVIGEPFLLLAAEPAQQQTPAQRDATRPPGTQERQTVPPGARTNPTDPSTPPGTQRTSPQTPPSTTAPQEPRTTVPVPPTSPTEPVSTDPTATPQTTTTVDQDIPEPNFPAVQPRPVPPRPSLTRVGVVVTDTLPLTMNEAIRRALENNNQIEVARHDVRLAESALLAFRGVYDPVFSYTPQYDKSIRPVTNIFGGASQTGTVSTTDYNNDFLFTKQVGRGGGNFSYFFNNTRETTSANNQTLNPFYAVAQGFSFTQPLWRNRSIDRNRQQIRIQQKRLQQSDADFRRSTIEVISQVQRAYWDLVFALRDVENQIANLDLARENFRRTEASVAAGASAPLERAEIQTELSNRESALLLASQSVTLAENNLKNLMLKDPLQPEWSRALVPTDQPSFDDTPLNLDAALKEARANRPEMSRLKLQSEINDIDLKFFKNQTKPRIDLTGTFQTNGLAGARGTTMIQDPTDPTKLITVPIPDCSPDLDPERRCVPKNFVGGYGQTLKNVFSFDTRQIVVGVRIELPFRNRTAKANLATAQIEREQLAAQTRSQDLTIEVEVRNAVQSVETARRRILTARQARQSAEEQLAGERRLFQVGRSTTFILFQRENQLVNARNAELRAETDYNKALADLQRATSTTLRINNVVIDSPYTP